MSIVDTFRTKIFGSNKPLYRIGSTKETGNLVVASSLEDAQSLSSYADGIAGLLKTIGSNKYIVYDELQTLLQVITSAIVSGDQQGIKEWNANLTFQQYGITREPATSKLYLYLSATEGNNVLTNQAVWLYLGDLTNIPKVETLAVASYGDFNATNWTTLKTGYYLLTGTETQFTNAPFKLDTATYIILIHNININGNVKQEFAVKRVDGITTPANFIYNRSFDNITDITNRGFTQKVQPFSFSCSATGLSVAVNIGATINLMTSLTNTNDVLRLNDGFVLKYTNGSELTTFLDATNDKFLFPSNLKSANTKYCDYRIRVILSGTVSGVADDDWEGQIELRRVIDNSLISGIQVQKTRSIALTNATTVFQTFVFSETDPFVVDGCYFQIVSDAGNNRVLTITSINYLISGIL